MNGYLVDSNIFLDIFTEDPNWYSWSSSALSDCADKGVLYINPIVYAEISSGFLNKNELNQLITDFKWLPLNADTCWLAAKCFLEYRKRGGNKRSPLPDFYIGAQSSVEKLVLVTRDVKRYKTYFNDLEIIGPD